MAALCRSLEGTQDFWVKTSTSNVWRYGCSVVMGSESGLTGAGQREEREKEKGDEKGDEKEEEEEVSERMACR